MNRNYIENHTVLEFTSLLEELEDLKEIEPVKRGLFVCNYLDKIDLKEGFIFQNYSLSGTKNQEHQRQYFSDENCKKVDSIRLKIEAWKQTNLINNNEYYFLLATLIENIDKVANTASVYGAFLKHLKKTATQTFNMKPAEFFLNDNEHSVFNEDIETLIERVQGDVLYLDPPYNHRQYAPNYHILETIARYDNPKIKGKTGLRDYSNQKSKFSQKKDVLKSFENVIQNANAKYIFLSYNNEGLMTEQEVKTIMSKRGEYGLFKKEYARFKADKDSGRKHKANSVVEYLHYIKCD